MGLLGFTGALAVPAPDRPVVRTAVFLAFEVEAWDGLENLEPGVSVAADFDLRLERSKRIERLIEQVAHDTGLWLIPSCADITDGQIIVHAHVALDETRDLPIVASAVVTLQDEDVAARRGAAVAFAAALVVGVGES